TGLHELAVVDLGFDEVAAVVGELPQGTIVFLDVPGKQDAVVVEPEHQAQRPVPIAARVLEDVVWNAARHGDAVVADDGAALPRAAAVVPVPIPVGPSPLGPSRYGPSSIGISPATGVRGRCRAFAKDAGAEQAFPRVRNGGDRLL